jgi:gas vesicle protein
MENFEVSLEKIELVKDRTGVSYREAKDALEAAGGSVVDAIIAIEDSINEVKEGSIGSKATDLIDYVKGMIHKGNVSKLVIKKDSDTVLNLPVNAGIIGTVLFPWATVAAIVAAFGTKCRIELVKDDGDVIDVSQKASGAVETVRQKSGVVADEITDKGKDLYEAAKDKASEVKTKYNEYKDKGSDFFGEAVDKGSEVFEQAKDKSAEFFEQAKEKGTEAFEQAKDKGSDILEALKERAAKPKEEVGEETEEVFDISDAELEEMGESKEEE